MADTLIPFRLIPFRLVPFFMPGTPARLPLVELRDDDPATSCTGPDGNDRGHLCLCHWAPWFDLRGRPEDGPDPDYEPPAPGDPLAAVPAAEPWTPRTRQGAGRA